MSTQLLQWNKGETTIRERLKVPPSENPTWHGLLDRYDLRLVQSPIIAVGTVDSKGRPWTTVWGGERGFTRRIDNNVLGINSSVATAYDPVFEILWGQSGDGDGEVVRPEQEQLVSAVTLDLETRDRIKLAGKMIGGAVTGKATMQLVLDITQSIGNCPKYITRRMITPSPIVPKNTILEKKGLPLSAGAIDLVSKTDLFFISSTNGQAMSSNHRGGPPGFMRVSKNSEDGVELVYPEYSGNRFYTTLGNIETNSKAGIVIPDFETGDVLYVTGSASILFGDEASSVLARSKLAIKLTVTDARFVRAGLPFRGSFIDLSPYNPPVRLLTTEKASKSDPLPGSAPSVQATLIAYEPITPNVRRFTFKLSHKPKWVAGSHVTFDFSDELDGGYAHMADGDPQSLNEDYIRTFTISSRPEEENLQITVRRHGPATHFLWRQNIRAQLTVPVTGFGGQESFHLPTPEETDAPDSVFVAGGVGITPMLAQAGPIIEAGKNSLELLWSLRHEDIHLAIDSFDRIKGLAGITTLFLTGNQGTSENDSNLLKKALEMGASVEMRRMQAIDFKPYKEKNVKFFVCAAPSLYKHISVWLEGMNVVTEDFGY